MLFESYYRKVKNCRTHGFKRRGKPAKCRICGEKARWEHYGYAGSICDLHYSEVQKKLETAVKPIPPTDKSVGILGVIL